MKAIIVAAGMGRRLSPYTDDRPKCLVPVAGKPLLLRQIEAYKRAGVEEIVVVCGYRGEQVRSTIASEGGVRCVDNPDFARNNILLSMMCASAEMPAGFLFSYADIVFRPELVEKVSISEHSISLVVDPFFAETYEGRTDHPMEEAELAQVVGSRVLQVGKRAVERSQAHGEFIGLMHVREEGAARLLATYEERRRGGLNQPYGRAPRFEVAYVTDLLNDVIAQGVNVYSVDITQSRSWREIDTVQDLHRAQDVVTW